MVAWLLSNEYTHTYLISFKTTNKLSSAKAKSVMVMEWFKKVISMFVYNTLIDPEWSSADHYTWYILRVEFETGITKRA